MSNDDIKDLVRIVRESGISELEVQRGDFRVKIIGTKSPTSSEVMLPTMVPVALSAGSIPAASASVPLPSLAAETHALAATSSEPDLSSQARETVVKSPIVGTFYDAPAPGTPPFVRVGDRVELRQVLCIIESMKLMNEIEAEVAGTLVAKHVENGRPVEYGETLFTILPL